MYLSKLFMIQIILSPSLVKMYQGKLLDGLNGILTPITPIWSYTYYFPQKIYSKDIHKSEYIYQNQNGQVSQKKVTYVHFT